MKRNQQIALVVGVLVCVSVGVSVGVYYYKKKH